MADKDLKALFQHALQDVYSAETAILKAMPRMVEAAQSEALRGALAVHQQETEGQIRRLDYGLLWLEPIESGREVEDAHEGRGGLLVAGGHGTPLLQPGPQPLDDIAVVVNPVRAGHRCLVALGRDRRT